MIEPVNNIILEKRQATISEKRQSRLGIASVAIALGLPVLLVLLFLISIALPNKQDPYGTIVAVGFIVVGITFPLLHLLGLIFGLIGLFSKKTKKLFPAIGALLNGLLILAGVATVVLFLINLPVKY